VKSKKIIDVASSRINLVILGVILIITVMGATAVMYIKNDKTENKVTEKIQLDPALAENAGDYLAAADGYVELGEDYEGLDRARFIETAAYNYLIADEYQKSLENYLKASEIYTELGQDGDVKRTQFKVEYLESQIEFEDSRSTDE
jgi:flagellar basal body-associated protein FliL